LKLEEGPPPALTLQPVIGQRKAAKSTVHVGGQPRSNGYVGGHSTADEGRELRRFDHVREDRGRRGQKKPHGGLTVSGEAAAKQSHKPFKQRKDNHSRALPEGNPAAFRTWYVPEGVDTGPSGHRNADGQGPKKPYGKKSGGGQARPGGSRPPGDRGAAGGVGQNQSRGPGAARGQGQKQGQRAPRPYGHPGNAPSFPSDHANPGTFNPYDRPRGPRPPGNRPPGSRPAGNRPAGPRGPRPGGNRGPRGGGPQNGNR